MSENPDVLGEYHVVTRQHIIDAVVEAAGPPAGAHLNSLGLDWAVAEGLTRRGYRLVKTDG